jgi:biopolymer transport protein ExbD
MRFYVKKRRNPPAVIIVALIDILIVLVIFLMTTTTFSRQPSIRLALPESSTAQPAGVSEAPPLIVSVDAKGELRLGTDLKPLVPERLSAELTAAVSRNPNLRLAISADAAAPWGQVVKVWDAAKNAKIKDKVISIFVNEAPPPATRGKK